MKKMIGMMSVVVVVCFLSGCIDKTRENQTITKIGIIEDVEYIVRGFRNHEKVTVLFEDGFVIGFLESTVEYPLHSLYLLAKNNKGNNVSVTYFKTCKHGYNHPGVVKFAVNNIIP